MSTRPSPSSSTEASSSFQGDGAPGASSSSPDDQEVMPFLDHLEELRWSLLKGGIGVLITTILTAIYSRWIVDQVLIGPTRPDFFMYGVLGYDARELELLNRTITGQFFADIGTILIVGMVAGSPIIVYYMWKFIEPALYPEERQGMKFASWAATFFFLTGIAFGYLILTPIALQFFAGYEISPQITNQFDIITYFSMISFWALGTGLLFELPVVVYFLSKVGLLTPDLMRTYRKYALLVVLVLGALLTPPDPFTQILLAVPLLLLYELSILVSVYVNKRRRRAASV